MTKQAILSVFDKHGVTELGTELVAMDWQLIASGARQRHCGQPDCRVTDVADLTGAPEMLGGRVKTLHPTIHGGILARQ